jgi:hypothetical protein
MILICFIDWSISTKDFGELLTQLSVRIEKLLLWTQHLRLGTIITQIVRGTIRMISNIIGTKRFTLNNWFRTTN